MVIKKIMYKRVIIEGKILRITIKGSQSAP